MFQIVRDMYAQVHFCGMHNIWIIVALFLLVSFCLTVKWMKSIRALRVLASARLRSLVLTNVALWRRVIKYMLCFIGFVSLFIACLQPAWNKTSEDIEQKGRDIVIAIDISRSMLCADEKPTRLEVAKQKIKKILYNLKSDRVALIVFAGDAVIQCPLTVDYSAFLMFLDSLDVETISSGTTSLDKAINTALGIFESMPAKKSKILCLFTDGEDFSTNLKDIEARAAKQQLYICTFGIGSAQGAPIPKIDASGKNLGFEQDDKGQVIMSKLNEGILKNIAQKTGGKYIHVTPDDRDIEKMVAYVEKFEKDSLGTQAFVKYQQQYFYFVMVSFICFGLEWLL